MGCPTHTHLLQKCVLKEFKVNFKIDFKNNFEVIYKYYYY